MEARPSAFITRVAPRAILAVVALVAFVPLLLSVVGRDDAANGAGGDFPSFYAAGRIVLDGRIDELYDADVQRGYQEPYHDDPEEFLYFAYPPITAMVYAPLAALPYAVAFAIQSLAALVALVAAIWLLWPSPRWPGPHLDQVIAASAVAVVAYPIAVSILGGQNTTFTLLLLAAVWRFDALNLPIASGLTAAAMLYKPQFGLIVIGVLALAGRWRALSSAVAGACVIYLISALGLGLRWPSTWLDQVRWFVAVNDDINGPLMVNIRGWVMETLGTGPGARILTVASIVLVAAATIVGIRRFDAGWIVFGLIAAGMLLVSPSTLAYDTGIAIVGAGLFFVLVGAARTSIGFLIVASWSQLAMGTIGWSPLFIVLVVIWGYQVVRLRGGPASVSQAPGTIAAPAES